MAYNSGNQSSDPVTVNGMFLKHYLDMKFRITDTFAEKNTDAFFLHVANLEASVMGKKRRAEIETRRLEIRAAIERGDYDYMSKEAQGWLIGFAVIEACTEFLNDAFHITQTDGMAPMDMTDDELMQEIQIWKLRTRIQQAYGHDRDRMRTLTARVLAGNIKGMEELETVMAEQDTMTDPQAGSA